MAKGNPIYETAPGRTFNALHAVRKPMVFPISDTEISVLASTTAKQSRWVGVGSFLLSNTVSLFASGLTVAGQLTPIQISLFLIIPLFTLVGSAWAFYAARAENKERQTLLDAIKAECEKSESNVGDAGA